MNSIPRSTSVEHALLAILSALIECGRTPDEIREGWATVAEALGLEAAKARGEAA